MSYEDIISDVPRGQQWSFALQVQGIPEVYTDGVASWQGVGRLSAYTKVDGALADRDFDLDFLTDVQDPFQVGSGMNLHLVDIGDDRIFQTYSKGYKGFKGYGRLATDLGAAASDTTLELIPLGGTTTIPDGAYLFVGGETMQVVSSPATNTYTVSRGMFDTLRDVHRVFEEVRPQVNTSPTTFGGRVATLWAAPVEELTGTLVSEEAIPLWAGVLTFARISDERVTLECEPLSYLLTRDWPQVLPTAQLLRDATSIRLSPEDHRVNPLLVGQVLQRLGGALTARGSVQVGRSWRPLGFYDETDTFTLVEPVERSVTVQQYLSWVQDTVIEADLFDAFDGDYDGAFSLRAELPEDDGGAIVVRGSLLVPEVTADGEFLQSGDLFITAPGLRSVRRLRVPVGGRNAVLAEFFPELQYLDKTQTVIPLRLDRPTHPFELTWAPDNIPYPVGVAVIGTGDDHETVLYRGVTVDEDDPRLLTLTGVSRGWGGTEARYWGADVSEDGTATATEGAVAVTQLLAVTEDEYGHEKVPAGHVPLHILLSTPDRGQNGDYDRLTGYRQGMRLPKRWVDTVPFEDLGARYMVPQVSAFWVLEQNKGKEPLSELLKMSGLHLVTRRFLDSEGLPQFGISLEAIDQPLATATTKSLDDDVVLSGARNSTTHNELLVINSTKTKPHESWGAKEGKGDEVFYWDEWSIGEYGRGKQLEFKPAALLNRFTNMTGNDAYRDREAMVAWLYEVSTRWFAAFGRGSYTAEIECVAPSVYRYQPGDLVAVSLSTLRNSRGEKGLVAPARVIKANHQYGGRAGGKLTFRLALDEFAELAPNMRVISSSETTAVVPSQTFVSPQTRDPFTGFEGAKELAWFDPERHGGPIRCVAWQQGNPGSRDEVLVTAVDYTANTVTISTSGGESSFKDIAPVNSTFIMTLAPYHRTTTSLSRLYAFLGSLEDELVDGSGGQDDNKVYA